MGSASNTNNTDESKDKLALPTITVEDVLDADAAAAANLGNNVDAPSQPLLAAGDHVEQIEDNIGPQPAMLPETSENSQKSSSLFARMERIDEPEPPTAMMFDDGDEKKSAALRAGMELVRDVREPEPCQWNWNHDGDEKKSAVLAARMELANDIRGPEPPMFSSEQAFLRGDNSKKSSDLIGGEKGAAFDSSNFETTNSFISFDSLEGQNYFRKSINNTGGRWDESLWSADVLPKTTHVQGDVDSSATSIARSVVNDEEKNDSIDSKSDSEQEEYIAVIPEAFLVEDDTGGNIIQATLVEPTPPWWKMRRAQQMFCFVILLIVPLSLSLGIFISPSRNQEVVKGAALPALSLAPSAAREVVGATVPASVANTPSMQSPAAAPTCSLDSNCDATLEIWTKLVWSPYPKK